MNVKARTWIGVLMATAITVVVVNGQTRRDPYLAFNFKVTIDGQDSDKVTGFFRSVSGLSVETEVVDYQEGGVNGPPRKLAGATRFGNIRLSRGFTGDRSLFEWVTATQKPNPVKVNGRITVFDRQGTRIASWKFVEAFPVKWELSELDASKNEVVIETIEIAHEGLTPSNEDDN